MLHFKFETALRFINDKESEIYSVLTELDAGLPVLISQYFDKKLRKVDSWTFKIVSSQMDADRLDYVQRDSMFAGIKGHGFDIERLFDLMFVSQDVNIAVDRGAIEAVEAYLVTLDQLWRAVYYHHAVRSATKMLTSLFGRAFELMMEGDGSVFPDIRGNPHPLRRLFAEGKSIPVSEYLRLTDAMAWSLIDSWRYHGDFVLCDISNRLMQRRLFKSVPLDPQDIKGCAELYARAQGIATEMYPEVKDAARRFVMWDSPDRTSYKFYDWKPERPSESIWLVGGSKPEMPIEADGESTIIGALRDRRKFDRLIMPEEVRKKLTKN